MRAIVIICLASCLIGCSGVSASFARSGKYAASLLNQASDGGSVSKTDVSKAFAEAEATATNKNDKEALRVLSQYRQALELNDGSNFDKEYISTCRFSVRSIFDDGTDPGEAGRPCFQKLHERVDRIVKEVSK